MIAAPRCASRIAAVKPTGTVDFTMIVVLGLTSRTSLMTDSTDEVLK